MVLPGGPLPRLIASIHDVGPRFESEVDTLHAQLGAHVGEARIAMLVVPDHWGKAPIGRGTPFASRLRYWSDAGVEMFVHGWFHRDEAEHRARVAAFKARHMTAGEGEFLGLSREEALRRMVDGRALIEDIIGRPATGFVAPAWLYGAGARIALAETGFALAEDHMRVWHPPTGRVLSRGPVITWASRSRSRIASSLFFAGIARRMLTWLPTLRVAVHPGDVHVPALRRSIDLTFQTLLQNRRVARYADLLAN